VGGLSVELYFQFIQGVDLVSEVLNKIPIILSQTMEVIEFLWSRKEGKGSDHIYFLFDGREPESVDDMLEELDGVVADIKFDESKCHTSHCKVAEHCT